MKLKQKASERVQRRYILIDSSDKDKIEQVLRDYLGVLGLAKASPMFVQSKNGKTILAVLRGEVDDVRAAIEMSFENLKIERVSGTIKGLG
ncbi:MAG: hypothetical protein AABX11_00265 [Nanoarchaeota archaeon]